MSIFLEISKVIFQMWILCALNLTCIESSLWSLLLNNPDIITDGNGEFYSRTAPKYLTSEHQSTNIPGRNHRHHHGLEICSGDHMCKHGMFCDRHYGVCDYLRKIGEHCRRDHHCENGHECVFGRCRKHIKKGEKGARCHIDSDCGPHMCCARNHGEYVCKSRLPVGHKCFIPNGGLDYALNEMCQCEEGLVCKNLGKSNLKQEGLVLKFQSINENIRCSRP